MTSLRAFGVAFGVITFLWIFRQFRRGRISRFDFFLGSVLSTSLFVIGIEPNTVNFLRALLSLEDDQFSRLIAISIVSNCLLWVLVFHLRFRWSDLHHQLDLLARALSVNEFENTYGDCEKLAPVLVVIPAFNEEQNIGHVLHRMPNRACGLSINALVIDDGSADQTFSVAREAGAFVVKNPFNRGGGAALRVGFDIARRFGSEFVVTMDADGQHDPKEINRLLKPIIEGEYDVVIGSRVLGAREMDSTVRYVGIHFFNAVIRLLTTAKVTDCSNGFRAMRLSELGRIRLRQDQFHTSEFIIDSAKKGIRIGEVPVTVSRRLSGESKKGKNWSYGLSFMKTVIKTWLR